MKIKCMFFVLPFLLSQTAFALNDKPEVCPSVTAIQTVSVDHAVHYPDSWVVLGPKHRYDTKEEWQFGIVLQPDMHEQDALVKAKEFMAALSPTIGGPFDNGKGGWSCFYIAEKNSERVLGVAKTPS